MNGVAANHDTPLLGRDAKSPATQPRGQGLWTQPEAAAYLNVSVAYLRASSCPKVLLPAVRGRKPLVRYSPEDVRSWIDRWRVA
jgi:hypothetical protein